MTQKQIEKAKNELRELVNMNGSNEQTEQIRKELSCREMINSILVYDNGDRTLFDRDGRINYYLREYAEEQRNGTCAKWYFIGMKRTKELIEEQKADFAKAKVVVGAFTDCEGGIYNSCKWADEQ